MIFKEKFISLKHHLNSQILVAFLFQTPVTPPWPSWALLKPSSLGSDLLMGTSPSCWDFLDEEDEDERDRERFFLLFLKAERVDAMSFMSNCL